MSAMQPSAEERVDRVRREYNTNDERAGLIEMTKQTFADGRASRDAEIKRPTVGDALECLVCAQVKEWGIFHEPTGIIVCKDCRDWGRSGVGSEGINWRAELDRQVRHENQLRAEILEKFRTEVDGRIKEAVEREREACAMMATDVYGDAVEAMGPDEPMAVGLKIAAAIRARREVTG